MNKNDNNKATTKWIVDGKEYYSADEAALALVENADEEYYDNFLDEIYGEIKVGSATYDASHILFRVDPVAYRCGRSDWENSEMEYAQELIEDMKHGDSIFIYGQDVEFEDIEQDEADLSERRITEAKKRLDILTDMGMLPTVKKEFEEEGAVFYSEFGILYWLKENNNCDELVEIKNNFEKKHNALVYAAIKGNYQFGTCLSFLYVSAHKEEWEMDNEALKDGHPFVWVENMSCPTDSEFGYIGIGAINGGLIRTA
jgi:hypothetical protein